MGCICDKDLFALFLVFTRNVRAKFVPKEVFVPPSANVSPKRKQQDQHHWRAFAIKTFLFSVFTSKCEGKIRIKGGFCAPKRECVPKQKSCPKGKQQDRCHWGTFSKNTFVVFFLVSSRMSGQNPRQKRLLCPQSENHAPKESSRIDAMTMHLR